MTRELAATDLRAVLDPVRSEPSLNIWFVADLENFGLPTDFLRVWGTFRGDKLQALVMRFYDNYVAYSLDRVLPDGLVEVLRTEQPASLSGALTIIDPIWTRVGLGALTRQYLAELPPGALRPRPDPNATVRRATVLEAPELLELSEAVEEFAGGSVDGWIQRIENPKARTYYIRRNARITSTASTNVECSTAAMIGAVMTHPDFRGQGLASACLTSLCTDLDTEGKVCCLTYDNPTAGGVYERLGFRIVSPWGLATGRR